MSEITSPVTLSVEIDGTTVRGDIGTITVESRKDGVFYTGEVFEAVSRLLAETASHLMAGRSSFALAPPGEGESRFPA
ncbi:hypothetical protein ABTX35_01955 [Streptomyces sp. NPDC096080]|uniref:hypothetical protein n=1 Tax=Streptomyces sp. NPDC096080 TaxID=3156693 RepID=UPI00331A9820